MFGAVYVDVNWQMLVAQWIWTLWMVRCLVYLLEVESFALKSQVKC